MKHAVRLLFPAMLMTATVTACAGEPGRSGESDATSWVTDCTANCSCGVRCSPDWNDTGASGPDPKDMNDDKSSDTGGSTSTGNGADGDTGPDSSGSDGTGSSDDTGDTDDTDESGSSNDQGSRSAGGTQG